MATKEKKKKISEKKDVKISKGTIEQENVTVESIEKKPDKKSNNDSTLKNEKKKNSIKKESTIKKWFKEVFSEFKKVRWPDKKEMIKYSIATIVFILFFALFFYVIEVAIYLINQFM